ncbi:hypothetical protein PDIG_15280 [Penicillium digitatum PHI26]|uniref:Uncharacterized protein n=2 Tax=Penicillium digitatum TaxID=36651 RepID=K9G7T3_PEND2|nr:hypothetical protein PDIP_30800 [Penicillium digitatum Pd1]EKV17404.1 hypothetical protein PDIG_15280 [Penicillium digitatum PHI26]EKV17667.1 hypothetical protein PDIP_30800 [Penicillium digitatum Pd1]
MPSLNLNLVAPSTHHVNSQCYDKRECSALAGYAVLSASSFSPLVHVTQIHVRLIQVVTLTTDSNTTWRIFYPSFYNPVNKSPQSDSRIERIIRSVPLPLLSEEGGLKLLKGNLSQNPTSTNTV